MFYDGDLPKDFERGTKITNGPGVEELKRAFFEVVDPVTFYLETRPEGVRVTIWEIRCHDSLRRYYTLRGVIVVGDDESIPFEASYWIRAYGNGGAFRAVSY